MEMLNQPLKLEFNGCLKVMVSTFGISSRGVHFQVNQPFFGGVDFYQKNKDRSFKLQTAEIQRFGV